MKISRCTIKNSFRGTVWNNLIQKKELKKRGFRIGAMKRNNSSTEEGKEASPMLFDHSTIQPNPQTTRKHRAAVKLWQGKSCNWREGLDIRGENKVEK